MKNTQTNETLFVPIKLIDKISQSDYKRKDDLYSILHLIYNSQIRFKGKLHKEYGYVPISTSKFKTLIAKNENIKLALDYLEVNCYIKINKFFVFDSTNNTSTPRSYKITSEYLSKGDKVIITDKRLSKRLAEIKEKNKKARVQNLQFAKSDYYKTFKINEVEAIKATIEYAMVELRRIANNQFSDDKLMQIINCEGNYVQLRNEILAQDKLNKSRLFSTLHKLLMHQQIVHSITTGNFFFRRNKTNGRLDSNLTSLPSYLRKYIICEEELYSLDFKNSQPFFLGCELRNNKEMDKDELNQYLDLVINGQLYEFLAFKYEEINDTGKSNQELRNIAKEIIMQTYYSKVTSYKKEKDFFRSIFPNIMNYIDQTNKVENNTLAILLQTKESTIVLDIIMKKLKEQNIIPFTIHDSFIVKQSELSAVKETITSTFLEIYDISPSLHEESLSNPIYTAYDEQEEEDYSLSIEDWLKTFQD